MAAMRQILVTGGAGYVGSALVPRLLERGYRVRVLDLFLYGDDVFDEIGNRDALETIKGDLRDRDLVARCVEGCDAVLHLACISNDPSFDLNPELGRQINFETFEPLVRSSVGAGVRRFIYASSSSVYGVSDAPRVGEDHPLNPLTDYSKYKAACEPILLEYQSSQFTPVIVRPATVCGYARRQRLDLTVNLLTNHALNRGKITVFGGTQERPNLHIDDMVDLYLLLLELPDRKIDGEIFNAGHQNHPVATIANIVQQVVQQESDGAEPVKIVTTETEDLRSYRITSDYIREAIGFVPKRTVEDAVRDLVGAFRSGRIPDPMDDDRYYNVKRMQRLELA